MKPRTRSRGGRPQAPLTVSLSPNQRSWVEARIETGGYGNISDYIRRLIRKDQRELARAELEKKLLAALDSGKPIEATGEYWQRKRLELTRRHGRARRSR
jgi:antitoxin ParD1/3/4